MKIRQFSSYDEYVAIQSKTNRAKITHVWVTERELQRVARYVRRHIPDAAFGICHGVRNGFEVQTLRRMLPGVEIIGTEISETALQFDNVIQWDFHEVKEEWLGSCDFIYSNSWDHSYDPNLLLERWTSCLKPAGRLFLEWTRNHMPKSVYGADCFGIDYRELLTWLGKSYQVEKVIRLNRSGFSKILQRPVYWLKGQLAPVRIVVVRNRQA